MCEESLSSEYFNNFAFRVCNTLCRHTNKIQQTKTEHPSRLSIFYIHRNIRIRRMADVLVCICLVLTLLRCPSRLFCVHVPERSDVRSFLAARMAGRLENIMDVCKYVCGLCHKHKREHLLSAWLFQAENPLAFASKVCVFSQ